MAADELRDAPAWAMTLKARNMPSTIPTRHYVAPNHAHRTFIEKYRFLNALYYLVVSNRQVLKENLAEATKTPDSVVGVVTHPISKTQFQGVFVPANDAREMAQDFGSFLTVLEHQVIATSYRYFVDYCMDLLDEIVEVRGEELSEKRQIRLRQRFMNLDHIKSAFRDELGISFYAESADESRLDCLLATRNAIEHSDCKATKEYLRLTGASIAVGSPIPASSKEVGEALSLVEHLANHVNFSCLKRWPIGR